MMRHFVSALLAGCIAGFAVPGTVFCQTAGRSLEDSSIAFIQNYMERWSSPNPEALAYMDNVFSDQTVYFNQTLTHAALMRAKRRFAERWPQRHFVVRKDNVSVSCDQTHLCTVWGLVDWHCSSPERHAKATGTSVFVFQVQNGQLVRDEDGFVIARGQILASGAAAAPVQHDVYSNPDIPKLRQSFYSESTDRDWIADWLSAQRSFSGTARSSGQASARELVGSDGFNLPYAVFQSEHGPIACMMTDKRPMPPQGDTVHVQGAVSIFIDQTMYLSHCSFG